MSNCKMFTKILHFGRHCSSSPTSFSSRNWFLSCSTPSRSYARFGPSKSRYSRSDKKSSSEHVEGVEDHVDVQESQRSSSRSREPEGDNSGRKFTGRGRDPGRPLHGGGGRDLGMEKYSPQKPDLNLGPDNDKDNLRPLMDQDRRRSVVRKFIQQAKSSYGAPIEGGKIGGDPFLTTPYVRGARRMGFDQGNDAAEESIRRKIDPETTSVVLFPGQGTQHVGMCGDPRSLPRYVQVLYEIASSILDYDLLDLCANGPQEKLNETIYSQPAILVSSLASLERLREEDPYSVDKCVATAGFSIGEISALVFAGVVSFEEAIRLVKVRAEAMQLASDLTPSGMATVLYGADSKLNYSLLVAKEWCRREHNIENPVCSVANYLFPHCKVVAGNVEALEFLEMNYKDFNLRRVKRLPVSGAFHTELMRPAVEPLRHIVKGMSINRPRMLVFSNVTGYRYHSSEELIKNLPKQIVAPVMWEQTLHTIYKRPKESEYPNSFECGPGTSLSTVLKQVNNRAFAKCKSILPFSLNQDRQDTGMT